MNLQEIISAAQGCAISVGFLYLTWKIPEIVKVWADTSKELKRMAAEEREKDRMARHQDRNSDMVAQGQLVAMLGESNERAIKMVAESVCRFNKGQTDV